MPVPSAVSSRRGSCAARNIVEYGDCFFQLAISEFEAIAGGDDVSQQFEAATSVDVVVESIVR